MVRERAVRRPPTEAVANASRNEASKRPPDRLQARDDDKLPLAWHKMSDMLLQSFNEWFDKFEQSFQTILTTQRELTELNTAEG